MIGLNKQALYRAVESKRLSDHGKECNLGELDPPCNLSHFKFDGSWLQPLSAMAADNGKHGLPGPSLTTSVHDLVKRFEYQWQGKDDDYYKNRYASDVRSIIASLRAVADVLEEDLK